MLSTFLADSWENLADEFQSEAPFERCQWRNVLGPFLDVLMKIDAEDESIRIRLFLVWIVRWAQWFNTSWVNRWKHVKNLESQTPLWKKNSFCRLVMICHDYCSHWLIWLIWLVVWNIAFMTFPSYWECHHPNWLTPSFFRGENCRIVHKQNSETANLGCPSFIHIYTRCWLICNICPFKVPHWKSGCSDVPVMFWFSH